MVEAPEGRWVKPGAGEAAHALVIIDHPVEEVDGGADCSQRGERDASRTLARQVREHRGHSAHPERQRQDDGCPYRNEARRLRILALSRGTCLHHYRPNGSTDCWGKRGQPTTTSRAGPSAVHIL